MSNLMALEPTCAPIKHTFSQLALSNTKRKINAKHSDTHTQVVQNTRMHKHFHVDADAITTGTSVDEKGGNQERRWIVDGRQRWIRDGIDTAAITRLWQIYRLAHSEPSPSLRYEARASDPSHQIARP